MLNPTPKMIKCLEFLARYEYISTTELKAAGYKDHMTKPLLYAKLVARTTAEPPPLGETRDRGRQLYYWWVTDKGLACLQPKT